jgi:hypothetical protein
MAAVASIPADAFLDQVIRALTAADAAVLHDLESLAARLSPPADVAQYLKKRATLASLLNASARNLRLLRRVLGKYAPSSL